MEGEHLGALGSVVWVRRAAEELRDRLQRAAAEHGFDGGLADVPVAGPEKAYGAVDGVDSSSGGFE